MIVRILIAIILIASHTFAQDTSADLSPTIQYQSPYLDPPYLSFGGRISGVSSISGGAPRTTVPTLLLLLDGYVPVKHPRLYMLLQFRIAIPFSTSPFPDNNLLPIIALESYRVGGGIGFGGIVADWRRDFKGWHTTMHLVLVLEGSIAHPSFEFNSIPNLNSSIITVGFETGVRFRYNNFKNYGISIGFDIGYINGIDSGDPFFVGPDSTRPSFTMLTYGFILGMHF